MMISLCLSYHAWVQQVFRVDDAHAASMAHDPNEVALVVVNALGHSALGFAIQRALFARLNHFMRGKVA